MPSVSACLRILLPLALAGCTWSAARSPSDAAPTRPAVAPRATVIQATGGEQPHWLVCVADCPLPTPKTRPSAVQPPVAVAPQAEQASPGKGVEQTQPAPEPVAAELSAPALTTPTATDRPRQPAQPAPVAKVLIHFPTGSARLDPSARARLERELPRLQRAGALRIVGRTDDTGSVEANNALASARAFTVIEWVRDPEHGIRAPWTSVSQGACCYLAPNNSAAGRATNRRVEIEIYAAGATPSPRTTS